MQRLFEGSNYCVYSKKYGIHKNHPVDLCISHYNTERIHKWKFNVQSLYLPVSKFNQDDTYTVCWEICLLAVCLLFLLAALCGGRGSAGSQDSGSNVWFVVHNTDQTMTKHFVNVEFLITHTPY